VRAMERIGVLVGVFASVMAAVYGPWTASTDLGLEYVGLIALILTALLGFMIAWYLWMTRKRLDRDPSDDPLGDIDEIQGEYGFFSPHSWQPLFLGIAAAVCFLGLAVGWWLFIIGAAFAAPALVSWTFEYWRGPHAL
jgi:disulfide bond formation protein DsbB